MSMAGKGVWCGDMVEEREECDGIGGADGERKQCGDMVEEREEWVEAEAEAGLRRKRLKNHGRVALADGWVVEIIGDDGRDGGRKGSVGGRALGASVRGGG